MPELPDLTIFARNLNKQILNRPIVSVAIPPAAKLNVPSSFFIDGVKGASITDVRREGKELFFSLSNGNAFSAHLMLNGKLALLPPGQSDKARGLVATLTFEDGGTFSISDWQGMCKVALNPKLSKTPDAMSERFTREYFIGTLGKNPLKNIKALLIDQHIIKGIGNAYADEILWKADISPSSLAGRIPGAAADELYAAIGDVLNDAIENILRISPDIISGEERSFLRVHNKNRKTSEDGEPIVIETIAGKTTYYTKKQRLF